MAAKQRETLQLLTALLLARPEWGGSLLVGMGLNDAGRALALASLAAGAAAIFLEEEAANLRAAQREGCCTFSVTSLDEALRIVKNEVRRSRAVTVALRGEPAAWLHEMAGRGVQPQAFAASRPLLETETDPVRLLRGRGCRLFSGFGLTATEGDSTDLEQILSTATRGRWMLAQHTAATLGERRTNDATRLAAEASADEDLSSEGNSACAVKGAARRWLQVSPALFARELERWYWQPIGR